MVIIVVGILKDTNNATTWYVPLKIINSLKFNRNREKVESKYIFGYINTNKIKRKYLTLSKSLRQQVD